MLDARVEFGELGAVEVQVLVVEPRHHLTIDHGLKRGHGVGDGGIGCDRDVEPVVVAMAIGIAALAEERVVFRVGAAGQRQPMGGGELEGHLHVKALGHVGVPVVGVLGAHPEREPGERGQ